MRSESVSITRSSRIRVSPEADVALPAAATLQKGSGWQPLMEESWICTMPVHGGVFTTGIADIDTGTAVEGYFCIFNIGVNIG
jgi:hypothetical protein